MKVFTALAVCMAVAMFTLWFVHALAHFFWWGVVIVLVLLGVKSFVKVW